MTGPSPAPPGRARRRVLDAALELFGEHGVSGTSLQMIADRIGITKAAVYHQFPAKDDIVLGLLDDVFASFEEMVALVESRPAPERHALLVTGVVGLIVRQRQVTSALYRDPETARVVGEHERFSATRHRFELLVAPDDLSDPAEAVRRRLDWAVIGAGFTRAVVDPRLRSLGDDELRDLLLQLAHRILD